MASAEGEHACVGEQHTGGVEFLAGVVAAEVVVHVASENRLEGVARAVVVVEDVPV